MTKETVNQQIDFEPMANSLAATFIQRRDLYAKQMDDGSYICIRKPLETSHVVAHLRGDITLGTYVLDSSSQARFIAFDADDAPQFGRVIQLSQDLAKEGVPAYLEESRRGGHLWLFFASPKSGKDAKVFAHKITQNRHLDGVEIFPKQDQLTRGPGSLIRLPFGLHRKTGLKYGFITADHQPLAGSLVDQCQILSAPQTVPEDFIKFKLVNASPSVEKPVPGALEKPRAALSQKIKTSMKAYDFIAQYVELSADGRGLCPFHVDQHASFSVNIEKNYWHCFAGCGGGSIIDFWMKWQQCDFTAAVRELSGMLLKAPTETKKPTG